MLSCRTTSITGTLPALRGALLFPAQMLGGIVVSSEARFPIETTNDAAGLILQTVFISLRRHADLETCRQRPLSGACFPVHLHSLQL